MTSATASVREHTSDIESFESSKSIKLSTDERFEKIEKFQENLSFKFDKLMEMLSVHKLVDTEFDARKHDVSSLDNDKSIDEDDHIDDTSSNEATNFIEKPHFSSHLHSSTINDSSRTINDSSCTTNDSST